MLLRFSTRSTIHLQGSQPIPIASSVHLRAILAAPTNRLLLSTVPGAIVDQDDRSARAYARRAAGEQCRKMIRVFRVGRDEMSEGYQGVPARACEGSRTQGYGGGGILVATSVTATLISAPQIVQSASSGLTRYVTVYGPKI